MIPAPRDQAYAALLDPAALETWLPPDNMRGRVLEFDPLPGGRFRMELTYLDGSRGKSSEHSDVTDVTFVELLPDERVVQKVVFDSEDCSRSNWRIAPVRSTASIRRRQSAGTAADCR